MRCEWCSISSTTYSGMKGRTLQHCKNIKSPLPQQTRLVRVASPPAKNYSVTETAIEVVKEDRTLWTQLVPRKIRQRIKEHGQVGHLNFCSRIRKNLTKEDYEHSIQEAHNRPPSVLENRSTRVAKCSTAEVRAQALRRSRKTCLIHSGRCSATTSLTRATPMRIASTVPCQRVQTSLRRASGRKWHARVWIHRRGSRTLKLTRPSKTLWIARNTTAIVT